MAVVKFIWQSSHLLWLERNNALHGLTLTDNEITQRSRIHPLVTEIYRCKDDLLPADQDILHVDLVTRLAQPLSIINTWLRMIQPAIAVAKWDAAVLRAHHQTTLDAYLPDVPADAIGLHYWFLP